MAEEQWPTLEEIEAQDRGRIDEAKVAAHRERMHDEQRAHRLAEIRRLQGLTQNDVAAAMHVSQRRVSAVERGALTRTELGTVASYVAALGGCVEIVANFGDERIVIASGEPGMIAMGDGGMIAITPEANEGQSRPDLSDRIQARRLQRPFCRLGGVTSALRAIPIFTDDFQSARRLRLPPVLKLADGLPLLAQADGDPPSASRPRRGTWRPRARLAGPGPRWGIPRGPFGLASVSVSLTRTSSRP